jgi:hypothetical protein
VTKAIARGEAAELGASWEGLEGFAQAYRETMARVGASSYYLFSEEYFESLRDALGEHLHLGVVRASGEVIAGALFTECQGIVQYHLGGTRDRFLPGNPIKLLFHEAAKWFKARGNRWLHLGGGVGGNQDSLMHFKLGFSPHTVAFETWRVIVNPERYEHLVAQAGNVATDAAVGFFPAYRKLPRATLEATR